MREQRIYSSQFAAFATSATICAGQHIKGKLRGLDWKWMHVKVWDYICMCDMHVCVERVKSLSKAA